MNEGDIFFLNAANSVIPHGKMKLTTHHMQKLVPDEFTNLHQKNKN